MGQLGHPGLGQGHGIRLSVISWVSWDDILGRVGHFLPPDVTEATGTVNHEHPIMVYCPIQEMRDRMASSIGDLMASDPDWREEASQIMEMLDSADILCSRRARRRGRGASAYFSIRHSRVWRRRQSSGRWCRRKSTVRWT